jgi:prepilin-type N-terminal cleavage/methylation domain-containing protein
MLKRTFTLVELMIAIAIIAILAAILIPAANQAVKKAEKAKAKSAAVELANAIRHYQSEYGVLPVAMVGTTDNQLPAAKYADFIKMLQGTKTTTGTVVENARAIKFLDKTDDNGTYKDPWDKDFIVYIDTNYSGTVTNGNLGIDGSVYQPVVVMSYGPKGKSDDIPNFVHSANVTYDKSSKKWKVVK